MLHTVRVALNGACRPHARQTRLIRRGWHASFVIGSAMFPQLWAKQTRISHPQRDFAPGHHIFKWKQKKGERLKIFHVECLQRKH